MSVWLFAGLFLLNWDMCCSCFVLKFSILFLFFLFPPEGAPNYYPNSFSGPVDNPSYLESTFNLSADVKRYESADDHNFEQVGIFYRKVCSQYQKLGKIFTGLMFKLLYWTFIQNKTTLTKYCLTQWISKLLWSFEVHWVRQYLVNFMGLAGIIKAIFTDQVNFHRFQAWQNILIFQHGTHICINLKPVFNQLRLRQNGCYFVDDSFKYIFKYIAKQATSHYLGQCRPSSWLTDICVNWPRLVNKAWHLVAIAGVTFLVASQPL